MLSVAHRQLVIAPQTAMTSGREAIQVAARLGVVRM